MAFSRLLASFLGLLSLLLPAPTFLAAATSTCDSVTRNCLPSCRTSCRTAKCLYQCHYDTYAGFLNLAVTPKGGPSLDAFFAAVQQLTNFFDDNVVVRIEPLGIYRGKMEVADYIATFLHPLGLSIRSRVLGAGISHFANTGNVSAVTFDLMYSLTGDPTNRITNLTGVMFSVHDNVTQKITKGDLNFFRFPQFQEELARPDPRVSDTLSANIIRSVCAIHEQVCRPAGYPGYANLTDCLTFIASIPRIAPYGIQGNNQYCRLLHTAYATVDPAVHCPHIGRSGGGQCVDAVSYTEYYNAFPRGTFVGKL